MKKAIVTAGSRGLGRAVADALKSIGCKVTATSRKELDTSDLDSVRKFIAGCKETDILVLNTGGPPKRDFFEIKEEEWNKYHRQLFLGFCLMLQKMHIKDGGYIFLISSFNIKEPDAKLILSNTYRLAFTSLLKSLSKRYAERNISCINIAPGPMKTQRLEELVGSMEEFEKKLPMKRAGKPEELGNFVKAIVENDIKYLNGVTINFDGGKSNYVL
jgi:3-oxoacyl-[acyl-carrier protein] reductase